MGVRRRRPQVSGSAVPVALTDLHDPVWHDPMRFADWVELHGLMLERFTDHGPLSRFHAAAEAWALAHGLDNGHGRARWVELMGRGVVYPRGRMAERMQALST